MDEPETEEPEPRHERPRPLFGRVLRRLLFTEEEESAFDEALIRTYLANERTFLAWLRSSVVLLGVGVGAIAIAGADNVSKELAFAVGGVSVFSAVLMVVWAYISYGRVTVGIEHGRYRPSRGQVATASFLVILAGAVILAFLLVEALV